MDIVEQKAKEIQDSPHVKRNWGKAIEWLIQNRWAKTQYFKSKDLAFKWWISGKSFDKFYADEVMQQKIKF